MKLGLVKTIFWLPRILCLVFATFLIIFSFDVFEVSTNIWKVLMGLLIHNIPTFVLYTMIYLTWKREWIASVVLAFLGIAYIVFFWGKFPLYTYFLIVGPLLLLSILYLINWIYRKDIRLRLKELKNLPEKGE